jgi:hypothetical protein
MLFVTTIWLITSPKFALNSLYKILVLKTKQDEKSPLGSFITKDLTLSKLESFVCVSISSCLLQNEKLFSGFLISTFGVSLGYTFPLTCSFSTSFNSFALCFLVLTALHGHSVSSVDFSPK